MSLNALSGMAGLEEISHLDDTNPYHPRITSEQWFWRLTLDVKNGLLKVCWPLVALFFCLHQTLEMKGVNLTCTCAVIYSPGQGRQRFCIQCGRWYHERCIQAMESGTPLQGNSDLERLSNLPIVRGWSEESHSSWEFTGSGYRVAAVKEWLNTGIIPDDWRRKVNEKWVKEVLEKMWVRYTCPQCAEML